MATKKICDWCNCECHRHVGDGALYNFMYHSFPYIEKQIKPDGKFVEICSSCYDKLMDKKRELYNDMDLILEEFVKKNLKIN